MILLRSAWLVPLLVSVLLASPAPAATLPGELIRLLPADPVAVMVAPSVDTLTRDLRRVIDLFDDEAAATFDPLSWLEGPLAALSTAVDPTRPAALAVRLDAGSPMPLVAAVLALRDPSMTADAFEAEVGMRPLAIEGGHVVVGTDDAYAPGNARPLLLNGMPETDLAARVDLHAVFAHYGPMIDLMMQMALSTPPAPAPDDDAGDEDVAPEPPMSPEQIDQTLQLLGIVREGVLGLEIAIDVDGTEVELHGGVELDPEGPLALGPQPDREAALALVRRLPGVADASMIGASALDLSGMLPLVEMIVSLGARTPAEDAETMDVTAALDRLVASLPALYSLLWQPHAWSMGQPEDEMALQAIVRAPSASALLAQTVGAMLALDLPGFSFGFEGTREVAGSSVQRYRYDFDLGEFDADEQQVEEALAAFEPFFHRSFDFAVRDDLVMVASGAGDESGIEELLRSEGRTGPLPAGWEALVEWAGPQARGWSWIDLTRVVALVAQTMAALPQDEDTRFEFPSREEIAQWPPMPIFAASSIDRSWLRGKLAMDLESVAKVARLLDDDAD